MDYNLSLLELAKALSDKKAIEDEIFCTINSLKETLQGKYIKKIELVAQEEKSAAFSHPSKEIALIKALREFSDSASRKNYDNVIDTLVTLNTIQNINNELTIISQERIQKNNTSKEIFASENESENFKKSYPLTEFLLILALTGKLKKDTQG